MYAFADADGALVRRLADDATIPWNVEAGGPLGGGAAWRQWEEDGSPVPTAYVEPPPELDDYRRAIQAHVDATARSRNYNGSVTCASYVGSTNPVWAVEAAAFVAWRDAVWTYAYAELAKVQTGQRQQLSVAEIIAELPAIDWPS